MSEIKYKYSVHVELMYGYLKDNTVDYQCDEITTNDGIFRMFQCARSEDKRHILFPIRSMGIPIQNIKTYEIKENEYEFS